MERAPRRVRDFMQVLDLKADHDPDPRCEPLVDSIPAARAEPRSFGNLLGL